MNWCAFSDAYWRSIFTFLLSFRKEACEQCDLPLLIWSLPSEVDLDPWALISTNGSIHWYISRICSDIIYWMIFHYIQIISKYTTIKITHGNTNNICHRFTMWNFSFTPTPNTKLNSAICLELTFLEFYPHNSFEIYFLHLFWK